MFNQVRNEKDEWLNNALIKVCTGKDLEILQRAIAPLTKLVDVD